MAAPAPMKAPAAANTPGDRTASWSHAAPATRCGARADDSSVLTNAGMPGRSADASCATASLSLATLSASCRCSPRRPSSCSSSRVLNTWTAAWCSATSQRSHSSSCKGGKQSCRPAHLQGRTTKRVNNITTCGVDANLRAQHQIVHLLVQLIQCTLHLQVESLVLRTLGSWKHGKSSGHTRRHHLTTWLALLQSGVSSVCYSCLPGLLPAGPSGRRVAQSLTIS